MEYSASYTGAGLLYHETESLYPLLIKPNADNLLRIEVKENKYLKINSERSRQRVSQEIRKRIQFADKDFWNFYHLSKEKEKRLLLFYLSLKAYRMVYDFHFNVTVPRVLSLEMEIDLYKYRMRLEEIASVEKDVAGWSQETWEKLITRYVYMLETAGLSAANKLTKPDVPAHFYCFFIERKEYWVLDGFLLKQHEKEGLIKDCNDN
jgi:hypothetical protein